MADPPFVPEDHTDADSRIEVVDRDNVNGLYIVGADSGRPMLKALYDDGPGREATVAELAFWKALHPLPDEGVPE